MAGINCLSEILTLLNGQSSDDVSLLENIISPPDLCHLFSDHSGLNKQLELYCQLKSCLINSDSKLEKISRRCQSRTLDDKKVPPGSNLVQRTVLDVRYLLSLLCLNIGLLEELRENCLRTKESPVVISYKEALTWYPRSIEGGYLLGTTLRHIVTNENELNLVQEFWEKAISGISSISSSSSSTILSNCNCSLCQHNLQRFNDKIISRTCDAAHNLRSSLILHYCQAGRMDLASPHLIAGRYVLVLSQEILHYPLSFSPSQVLSCQNAMGVDNILPLSYLKRLQLIFRPQSPFWSEHHYDFFSNASRSVGYYSYLSHHLKDDPSSSSSSCSSPSNFIEQVIQQIYRTVIHKFPEVESEATVAEWWVHSRPHSCGHQFHFDSDETAIYAGKAAQHPIISCVLYLSPDYHHDSSNENDPNIDSMAMTITEGHEIRSIGGPTVVTNQTLQSEELASHGFMFHPKENRLVAFDAKYLHGVIPGRGVCPGPPDSRRVTFMVGFWKKIQSKTRENEEPGPGQPFPSMNSSRYTWHHEMAMLEPPPPSEEESHPLSQSTNLVSPLPISRIWQPVVRSNDEDSNSFPINSPYNSCFQGF